MKRIIDGRCYDTDTAEEVASDTSDFYHWTETLYRTKAGAWFLVGLDDAMSRYAEQTGQNEWSGDSRLEPRTDGEALAWLEEHECREVIERYFAEPNG